MLTIPPHGVRRKVVLPGSVCEVNLTSRVSPCSLYLPTVHIHGLTPISRNTAKHTYVRMYLASVPLTRRTYRFSCVEGVGTVLNSCCRSRLSSSAAGTLHPRAAKKKRVYSKELI